MTNRYPVLISDETSAHAYRTGEVVERRKARAGRFTLAVLLTGDATPTTFDEDQTEDLNS